MDFKDEEEVLLLLLLAACCNNVVNILRLMSKKKSRKRILWVKPWLKRRAERSVYHNIVSELRIQDRYDFRKYFRMNAETFEVCNDIVSIVIYIQIIH